MGKINIRLEEVDSVADPAPPKKSLTALCAVVTGANKGIGLAVVRNLAELGVQVVLTARDEDRGLAAVRSLHSNGLTNVLFHQLDVRDPSSVTALACFLADRFSKLDILVNNAGVSGVDVDAERLNALKVDPESWLSGKATNLVNGVMEHKYEDAVVCIDTNYFGCKRVTEALLPLLRLSPIGASIVNVSSLRSELRMLEVAMIRLCHVNDAMPEVVPSVAVDGGWVFALRGQGVLCCLKLVRRLSPPLFRFVEFRKAKRKRANESLSLLLVDNANAARLFSSACLVSKTPAHPKPTGKLGCFF
ncbi:hypothetical protein HPP92_001358 [Vanilla planifolia]|uniref:Uncharacterized protein n=1 Tax=Vanilla planifolia TaxID=51239 RepID=A0A835S423_VANPL|nr:hypothetical protein HPP92_001358 [Vanilla planifolia]